MDSVMMNGATPCEVLQILEQKQQLSELQPVITEDDDDPAFCTALLRGAKINELFVDGPIRDSFSAFDWSFSIHN